MRKIMQANVLWFICLMLSLTLFGCSAPANQSPAPGTDTAPQAVPETTAPESETTYPLSLTDGTNTSITLEQEPKRVITLAPSETEILFAIGAGDKVVGVDQYSDYPEEAKSKEKVGDMNTNVEAVIALQPDLVVASASMNQKAIEQLRSYDIKVYASSPKTVDQVIEKIETVGKIMNLQQNAKHVAEKMRADKQSVVDAVKDVPKKKVYLEYNPGWTVGKGEFLDELISLAGGINVGGDKSGWYEIDPEHIIQANPEIILYPEGEGAGDVILDGIKKRPGWGQIDAVKNNRMFSFEQSPVVRVGPRLTDGLKEIAKAIHPDLVK
ncbi:ABC transporter substrate-binding protein [Brevibacillus sp. B_LB10_24]|uniref:ABC transporter substrate-binding protein n=1 Tax=Brevibacillus sp. B_LB10_24 TaxID=3380645 RepID=UPI0038B7D3A5